MRWWVRVVLALAATAGAGCGESLRPVATEAWPKPPAPAVRAVDVVAETEAEQRAAWSAPLPFRLPAGYVAERVAAGPLVKHPMFAALDDRGRLYVAGSSGQGGDAAERSAH